METAGPPSPSAGTSACTVTSTAGAPSIDHGRRIDVSGEPAGDRAVDLLAGAGHAVVRAAVEGRGVPRALGGGGGQGVADHQHQRDLEDAEEERHEHDQDQHEVHDRGPALAAAPGAGTSVASAHRVEALRSMSLSWSSATPQMTATRPAVITVISTQPGTSPRSSRRGLRQGEEPPGGQECQGGHGRSSSLRGHGVVRSSPTTPGQKAKSTVTGQHQEDDRHHHEDLLARGDLDQLAATGLADVGRLGVQHVGQRGARARRRRRCPGRSGRPAAGPVVADHRSKAAPTGSPVRTAASTFARSRESSPPLRRTTRSRAATGLSPAATARASSSAMVGNSARILALAVLDLAGEVVVADEHAERERRPRRGAATTAPRRSPATALSTPYAAAIGEADQPPEHLLDPELVHGLVDVRALEPAAYGRGAAQHPLDTVGRRAQQRTEDAGRCGGRRGRGDAERRAAPDLRQVADVGQHPDRELGPPDGRDARQHERGPRRRRPARAWRPTWSGS